MINIFHMLPMTQSTINMDLLVSPSSKAALRDYNASAWATSDDRWHLCCNGAELMVHGLQNSSESFLETQLKWLSWGEKDFNMLRFPPVSTAASKRAKSAEVATWSLQPPRSPRDASLWIVSRLAQNKLPHLTFSTILCRRYIIFCYAQIKLLITIVYYILQSIVH